MAKYITTRAVKHNGKLYEAGTDVDKIKGLTDEQGEALFDSGAIEVPKGNKSSDAAKK